MCLDPMRYNNSVLMYEFLFLQHMETLAAHYGSRLTDYWQMLISSSYKALCKRWPRLNPTTSQSLSDSFASNAQNMAGSIFHSAPQSDPTHGLSFYWGWGKTLSTVRAD